MNKLLFTDSRFHYPWSTCLLQLIRWIHLILKPKSKKHECARIWIKWVFTFVFGKEIPPRFCALLTKINHLSSTFWAEFSWIGWYWKCFNTCQLFQIFFRRNVGKDLNHTCSQQVVNSLSLYDRKSKCSMCRLQRCLDCGMSLDGESLIWQILFVAK